MCDRILLCSPGFPHTWNLFSSSSQVWGSTCVPPHQAWVISMMSFYVFISVFLWRLLWQILNFLVLLLLLCFSGFFVVNIAFCCCPGCDFLSVCFEDSWQIRLEATELWDLEGGVEREGSNLQTFQSRVRCSLSVVKAPAKPVSFPNDFLGAHSRLPQIARSPFLWPDLLGEGGVDMVYITLGRLWLCHMAVSAFGKAVKKRKKKRRRKKALGNSLWFPNFYMHPLL